MRSNTIFKRTLLSLAAVISLIPAVATAQAGTDLERLMLEKPEEQIAARRNAEWEKYLAAEGGVEKRDEAGNTLLHRTAAEGRVELCKFLISRGADVNARNDEGKTPLMMHTKKDAAMWNVFLDAGVDVNQVDEQGNTSLHLAVMLSPEMVPRLLESGVKINAQAKNGMTPLCAAVQSHSCPLETVKQLLEAGADVNLHGEISSLRTALHYEKTAVAHLLVDAGADVKGSLQRGALLPLAIRLWDTELIRKMLKGEDVDPKDQAVVEALCAAAGCGNTEICALLLEKGVDVNAENGSRETAISLAIAQNEEETVRFLLEKGAKVDGADETESQRNSDRRELPLKKAVLTGNVELCKLLVKHGAHFLDMKDSAEKFMHAAVKSGNVEMCRYVANFNPDVNVRTQDGMTPLHVAAEKVNYELCVFLISRGADVNAKSGNEGTPLHYTARQPSPLLARAGARVALLLMEAGADAMKTDSGGRTMMENVLANSGGRDAFFSKHMQLVTGVFRNAEKPDSLLMAAYDGDAERMKRLMDGGKSVILKDKDGESAIHFAIRGGKTDMVKFLLENGVKTDTPGHFGGTPLHYAASLGHREIVELLLEKGADINARDKLGATPLFAAVEASQGACVVTLVRKDADMRQLSETRMDPFILALRDWKYTYCDFFVQNGYDVNADFKFMNSLSSSDNLVMNLRTLKKLKEYGMNFAAQDKNGMTLLHHVFQRGGKNMPLQYILENGGDANIRDKQGKLAMDYARSQGRESLKNKLETVMRRMRVE